MIERSKELREKNQRPKNIDLQDFNLIIKDLPKLVQTKIQLSDFFNTIHKKMTEGIYYQDILNDVFSSLDSLIPFDRIGIAMLENEGNDIRLNWVKSKIPIKKLKQNYSAVIKGSSLQKIIQMGRPRILKDLQAHLVKHPKSYSTKLALEDGIRSSLTCPLIVDGRPYGVIFFSSATPHTYDKSHVEIYNEISEGMSLIIQQGLMKESITNIESKESIFRNTIHDLNNPLNIIQGTLDLMTTKEWCHQLGPDSQKALSILSRNCESMINLINDLTNMGEVKMKRKLIYTKKVDLYNFLIDIRNDSEVMARKKGMHICLSKGHLLPSEAFFDPHRIKEALENFISNAVKYSNANTNITITIDGNDEQEKIYFTVQDQGLGIPQIELGKLFKDFGKTSVRPTGSEPSSGLGLSIVKHLIEAHGGDVFVNSEVGKGSTFGFWIPLITPSEPTTSYRL